MPFESPDYRLSDLLLTVSSGKVQLPDFQREWKWEDDRIRSLIASISAGHPVGVIMMLELGGDGVRFKPKPLAGVPAESLRAPERLLLDGQQRLTSLFQALASGKAVDTMDARGKRVRRWYYIDIDAALSDDYDEEEAIVSVPEDRRVRDDFGRTIVADYSTVQGECHADMFPLSRVFAPPAIFEWQAAYVGLDADHTAERFAKFMRFYEKVLLKIIDYVVPVIVLTKETPKEAVCTVFEKVNTGGVPLNVFELLTASFASDDFRLNDDWQARRLRLAKHKVLASLESTDLLQAVSLLATRTRRLAFAGGSEQAPGISCKRRDILRLTLPEYREWAEPVTQAFLWAASFMAEERIFRAADLPYRTQLVPLAAIRVALGPAAETYGVIGKLRRWYWCGVLGELYGGATETRFARDLEQVVEWAGGGPTAPGTVEAASFRAPRLLTLRTRNSAAYKGIYALLMDAGCRDWVKHQAIGMATFFDHQIDIHHIFPKAWCEKQEIDAGRRESIVNKTAIAFDTNRSIGGRAPGEYILTLEKKAGVSGLEVDAIIATHQIDPQYLRTSAFDAFFTDRSERLLRLISTAMGKEAIRDEMTDEGDPMAYEPETEDSGEALDLESIDIEEADGFEVRRTASSPALLVSHAGFDPAPSDSLVGDSVHKVV